jgi:hypothetical protein
MRGVNLGSHSFAPDIRRHMNDQGEVVIDDSGMAVIGGRRSIIDAFARVPCAEWRFSAPEGQMIYASHQRSSAMRGKALGLGAERVMQLATGPVSNAVAITMTGIKRDIRNRQNHTGPDGYWKDFGSNYRDLFNRTYNSKVNKQMFRGLGNAMKSRTVLYLYSANQDFDGTVIAQSTNGAELSLILKRYFGM